MIGLVDGKMDESEFEGDISILSLKRISNFIEHVEENFQNNKGVLLYVSSVKSDINFSESVHVISSVFSATDLGSFAINDVEFSLIIATEVTDEIQTRTADAEQETELTVLEDCRSITILFSSDLERTASTSIQSDGTEHVSLTGLDIVNSSGSVLHLDNTVGISEVSSFDCGIAICGCVAISQSVTFIATKDTEFVSTLIRTEIRFHISDNEVATLKTIENLLDRAIRRNSRSVLTAHWIRT